MTDDKRAETRASEAALADIFRDAAPRPRPAQDVQDAAFAAVHSEWQALTRRRRWQRRGLLAGVAASLVVAVLAGLQWRAAGELPVEPLRVDVLRASGALAVNGAAVPADELLAFGLRLAPGDTLVTAPGTRAALTWHGGSLRLDQDTTVALAADGALRLERGSLYFDSQPAGQAGAAGRLDVLTRHGRVRHAGTQFQVRQREAALDLAVREGRVTIEGPRVDVALAAGERLTVAEDGGFRRAPLASHAADWAWAADIAPELPLAGRTTAELLDWIARETGLQLRYASPAVRARAASEARGLGALAPLPALRTIPVMTSLDLRVADGVIHVDIAAAPGR